MSFRYGCKEDTIKFSETDDSMLIQVFVAKLHQIICMTKHKIQEELHVQYIGCI